MIPAMGTITVSYTHLDVYKRQLNLVVESHSLTVSAVGVLRVNEIALIALSGKRQRPMRPLLRAYLSVL